MLDHANASMHIAVLSTLNSCSYPSVFGMVSCPLPVAAVCFLSVCLWEGYIVVVSFVLLQRLLRAGDGTRWTGNFPPQFLCIFSTSLICEGCSVLYSRPVAPLISCACLDDAGSLFPQLCVPKGFFVFVLMEKNIFIFSVFSGTPAIPFILSLCTFFIILFL